MRSISSTNSGLPWAAAAIRPATSAESVGLLEQVVDQPLLSLSASGSKRERAGVLERGGPVRPQLEQLEPGHARTIRIGALGAEAGQVLDQVEEGRLGPVDVVEHDDQRLLAASASSSLRIAQKTSPGCGLPGRQPDRARDAVDRQIRVLVLRGRSAAISLAGFVRRSSSSRSPAASLTISATGQNVMPSP